jgi:hypothetical protein
MRSSKILTLVLLAFLLTSNKCSDKKKALENEAAVSASIQNPENFDPVKDMYNPWEMTLMQLIGRAF